MLELYIIAFLILFTNQKHKNMSLTSFVCSLSNHQVKSFKKILCARDEVFSWDEDHMIIIRSLHELGFHFEAISPSGRGSS